MRTFISSLAFFIIIIMHDVTTYNSSLIPMSSVTTQSTFQSVSGPPVSSVSTKSLYQSVSSVSTKSLYHAVSPYKSPSSFPVPASFLYLAVSHAVDPSIHQSPQSPRSPSISQSAPCSFFNPVHHDQYLKGYSYKQLANLV